MPNNPALQPLAAKLRRQPGQLGLSWSNHDPVQGQLAQGKPLEPGSTSGLPELVRDLIDYAYRGWTGPNPMMTTETLVGAKPEIM